MYLWRAKITKLWKGFSLRKIQLLIDTLSAKESWKTEELLPLLRKVNITERDIAHFQLYNHEKVLSYGRNKIYANRKFRIYLMSWDYGNVTAIHDHGSTGWGAVQFYGELEHHYYKYNNEQLKMVLPVGAIVPVQGSIIHMMANC